MLATKNEATLVAKASQDETGDGENGGARRDKDICDRFGSALVRTEIDTQLILCILVQVCKLHEVVFEMS